MKDSNLKNMVILKNLPSNLVDEAIVILKNGAKVKQVEKIENATKIECRENESRDKDYILKEAEMIVSNYISDLEAKKENRTMFNNKINKKYNKMKKYVCITTFVIFIQTLIILVR